jgi:hypothetical protein
MANLSMREAAALPLIFITAWEGLVDRARVGAGKRCWCMAVLAASATWRSSWRWRWARRSMPPAAQPARQHRKHGRHLHRPRYGSGRLRTAHTGGRASMWSTTPSAAPCWMPRSAPPAAITAMW